jgi:sterol desaturase/sphingolipid hydroxylase (fatty acid hydroxylase superfamily)
MAEFSAQHFAFMAPAYSAVYGVVNGVALRLLWPLEMFLAFLMLETVFPKTRNSFASTKRSALYVTISLIFNGLLFSLISEYFNKDQLHSLVILDLRPLTQSPSLAVRIVGWLIAAFAASMIGNFFYYWVHRSQHRFAPLWAFHRVHHSITEMSALSSYHHLTEDTLQYFCVGVPLALLLRVDDGGAVPWIVLTVVGTHAFFIHSSVNLNIGPLRYIIGDNHFHRIHHSREERHFDKNFGTSTPLWDVLFGTAHFPKKGEWPAVGLSDVEEPKRVLDFFLLPFQK